MGSAGRQRVVEHYQLNTAIGAYVQLYEELSPRHLLRCDDDQG